ncbi:MAG: Gfo/Idh/MocA family oxidoreductase [Bacteroidales bacterium]|nr:Gfo/Idh/MocA family oxidoreductase [Bacteroidales bacterium]
MKVTEGTVKWGIIGAGDVCEKKSGPAFSRVPDSELVAVMRRDLDKAKDYARRHHVLRYYGSVHELLADAEVNAIYIATPPAYHEEYAIASAKAGKQVYIEKPVTIDSVGCEKLIKVARQQQVRMSVAHYRRKLPLFLKVKELIEQDAIGEVRLVEIHLFQSPENNLVAETESNWRIIPEISGGGLFHDLAPHQLDILCWLFGEPDFFSGYSFNQGGAYGAPDTTRLSARFQCSVFMNGVWSFNMPEQMKEDSCVIYGAKGKIRFSFFRDPLLQLVNGDGCQEIVNDLPATIQQPMIRDVVRFFKGEIANPAPLEEALWTMQLLDSTL